MIAVEPATIQTDYPVCTLCGGINGLDTEVVLCVSVSTWTYSFTYTETVKYLDGTKLDVKKTNSTTSEHNTDPKEWTVCLCEDCRVNEYIEANAAKAKKNRRDLLYAAIGLIVGGAVCGGLVYLISHGGGGGGGSNAYDNLDKRLVDEGSSWVVAILIAIVGFTAAAFAIRGLVYIPMLVVALLRRKALARSVSINRKVPASQRLFSFSQTAKRILGTAESGTMSTVFGTFPVPNVPTAEDCGLKPPIDEHTKLRMTTHLRLVKVRRDGKWGCLDDQNW
jgi:hypothetical protein